MTQPDNTIDSEVEALVDKIFNHGRAVEQHESPYSHTPPKFYEELTNLIAQEANKAVVAELEKMKADAKKDGTYTENTAGGLADEIDDRIAQLKGAGKA